MDYNPKSFPFLDYKALQHNPTPNMDIISMGKLSATASQGLYRFSQF